MINYYFKNRLVISVVFTILAVWSIDEAIFEAKLIAINTANIVNKTDITSRFLK